jgi:hypothetical protein
MRNQTWIRLARLAALPVGLCLLIGAARAEAGAEVVDAPARGLAVGARVRVQAPGQFEGWRVGRVLELGSREVVLDLEGRRPLSIRREAIRRIDVSVGRKHHAGTGALAGAGLGAVGGVVYLATITSMSDVDFDGGQYALATLGGAAGGAMLGAVVGLMIESDRWHPVADAPVRVSVRPVSGRGIAVGFTVEF